jgi:hypothetical protein
MDPEGCTRLLNASQDDEDYDERDHVLESGFIVATRIKSQVARRMKKKSDPLHAIYTAVLLQRVAQPPTDASMIFRKQTSSSASSSPSVASSISSLDEEEPGSPSGKSSGRDLSQQNGSYLSSFQLYSVMLGLMVGIFIQLSSLGANYLLSEVHGKASHNQETEASALSTQVIVKFSLVWSVLTSILGVSILYLIRELVTTACDAHGKGGGNALVSNRSLILHLECYFAIGTLSGVCIAWTCTDLLLGLEAHFLHSLATLGMALVWCKFITNRFAPNEDQDSAPNTEPLLLEHASSSSFADEVAQTNLVEASSGRRFKVTALTLGVTTGFFIQFSSLGANFILSQFIVPHHQHPDEANSKLTIATFSIVWSVLTSGMGTIILSLARGMIVIAHDSCAPRVRRSIQALYSRSEDVGSMSSEDDEDDGDGDDTEEAMESTLLRLEGWFAIGALFGVNAAWMATDLVMGLKVNYLHALLTEGLLLLAVVVLSVQTRRPARGNSTSAAQSIGSSSTQQPSARLLNP